MHFFVKKLFIMAFSFVLIFSSTNKAEAGLAIGLDAQGAKIGFIIGTSIGVLTSVGVALFVDIDGYPMEASGLMFGAPLFGMILGVVLDVNTDEFANGFEEAFNQKYPFVDNQEIVTQFKDLLMSKLPKSIKGIETHLVSISENDTLQILSSTDLTSSQKQLIVDDLK